LRDRDAEDDAEGGCNFGLGTGGAVDFRPIAGVCADGAVGEGAEARDSAAAPVDRVLLAGGLATSALATNSSGMSPRSGASSSSSAS
jgi:hypothetical protein